jgi:Rrf2 family protein
MMLDMAQRYDQGPIQIGEIAKRQDISVKYLEQLIIPLKHANYVDSVRGPKGGHMLAKSPDKITVGEIVDVLEGGINLTECVENPKVCDKSKDCLTRNLWEEATKAMHDKLNAVTLAEMVRTSQKLDKCGKNGEQ